MRCRNSVIWLRLHCLRLWTGHQLLITVAITLLPSRSPHYCIADVPVTMSQELRKVPADLENRFGAWAAIASLSNIHSKYLLNPKGPQNWIGLNHKSSGRNFHRLLGLSVTACMSWSLLSSCYSAWRASYGG